MEDEDPWAPFVRIGPMDFLLHDRGWFIAWRQVIRIEARWPTYRTKQRLLRAISAASTSP